MKIIKIETIPVSLPVGKFNDGADKVFGYDSPSKYNMDLFSKNKYMLLQGEKAILSNVIVKIFTDEGFVGIGDAACDKAEPVQVVKSMIDNYIAPRLIGKDPLDWHCLIEYCSWETERAATRHSISGIDLALYDLVGKILDVPVYTLLGGLRRNKLLASIEVPRGTPDDMAEHSFEYYNQGIRGIKAKIGSNPEWDVECLIAIREKLGPNISLRADANCGYTVKEAIRFCKLVEKQNVDLEILEQPVALQNIFGLKEVKNSTYIPIEADESAFSLTQVHHLLKNDAVDLINTKCAKALGILGVMQWASVAEAANIPIVIGTEWGTGVKIAAKLHLCAAIKNTDCIVELTEMMIHELLLKEQLVLTDGYLDVPTTPGLGLELDEEKVEAFRTPGL